VVIVTVLIWIYAEMEFTQTADVAMTIRFGSTGPGDTVVTSDERTRDVTFQLRGSRSDLDRFAEKYRGKTVNFDLSTVSGLRVGDGQSISSVSVLESVEEVQRWGLQVVSGIPANLGEINIERLEPRKLSIEFAYKGAELAEAPSADVTVWAPQSRWSRIPPNSKIRTIERDLTDLPAGEDQEVTFKLLSTLGTVPVRLDKAEVTVRLQVVRRTAAATESIPVTVRIVTPAEWAESAEGTEKDWAHYKLVRRDSLEWRTRINVTGPRKDMDILRNKTKTIDAYIVLTDSDTEPIDSWSSREVTLRFPPGLNVQLASGQEAPSVQFRLEKRAATTP